MMTPDLNDDSNQTSSSNSSTSSSSQPVVNNLKRKNLDTDDYDEIDDESTQDSHDYEQNTNPTTSNRSKFSNIKNKVLINQNLDDTGIKTRSQKAKALLLQKTQNLANQVNTSSTKTPHSSKQTVKLKLDLDPKTENLTTTTSTIIDLQKKEPLLNDEWLKTFETFNPKQKLNALEKLLELCDHTHIKHVHNYIEPKLQRDYISELPRELILYLLTYIRPKDLFKLAQVSVHWNQIADDSILWKNICKKYRINMNILSDGPLSPKSDSESENEFDLESKSKKLKANRNGKNSKNLNSLNFLNSFNPFKKAYLIDSNVTRNWCTRSLPTPIILKSHDDHVITCLKFDGRRVVSGSDDNTLKIWCAQSGKLLNTLIGHSGGVWASQLKDNIVVSGSTDRTVRVWNLDTGECIHVLTGHTSTVRCLALNGNICISGSRDSLLRVWDIETGQCLQVLRGHQAAVRCVCFDGKYVVSGSYDFTIRVWNPYKNECIHILEGHINRVYSLLFDGNRIVSGSLDTTIIVWDVHTGGIIHKLTGHHSLTSGMQIKGDILVSGNADSTVKIWSLKTGECLHTLSGCNKHMSAVTCLGFNDKFVVSSSDDGTVKLWNLETGEFIRNLLALESGGRGGVVWRISMHKNKLVCAVGSRIGVEETKLILLDFDWPSASLLNQPVINSNGQARSTNQNRPSGLHQILSS
ncbi:unnamed protein product [Brachionus calyciflorus]|uniref:F-box domain-containing protein n=1 Tax=Brachionus calyciflorus TaxID=104777 RepID=A0A813NQP3_9BILA|nr:unnamed protein product [Brachionus calyciflorus]